MGKRKKTVSVFLCVPGEAGRSVEDRNKESRASPVRHLWDSGANSVDELNRVMPVRALAWLRLDELRKWALAQSPKDTSQRAHLQFGAAQMKRFQDDPKQLG